MTIKLQIRSSKLAGWAAISLTELPRWATLMAEDHVERRLAAILAADVVGYSRLMESDEAGTLARLKTLRLEVIDPAIIKCKGRVIKTTGDGMLVEFHSVTEALLCAVDFQEGQMFKKQKNISSMHSVSPVCGN